MPGVNYFLATDGNFPSGKLLFMDGRDITSACTEVDLVEGWAMLFRYSCKPDGSVDYILPWPDESPRGPSKPRRVYGRLELRDKPAITALAS